MNSLPPIPTPPAQRWVQFRNRILPVVIFAGVLLSVAGLWRQNLVVPTLVGQVEPVRAQVSSPKQGTLSELRVGRLQHVRAGETIAKVVTTDPKVLDASLAVTQAEIRSLRASLQPIMGQQRYALNLDMVRLDWMEQRVQLATARVQLQYAENELRRMEELYHDKVVAEKTLDQARTAKQRLEAEVGERAKLVNDQEQKLGDLRLGSTGSETNSGPKADDILSASIKVQEAKLQLTEAELRPVTLTAPIEGTVTAVHHRSGEAVRPGDAILSISGMASDRIVCYAPQPLVFTPEIGMKVHVRCRSTPRSVSSAEILGVGSQLETISPELLPSTHNHLHLVGLPILVSLPSDQRLMPGEIVDLVIQLQRN